MISNNRSGSCWPDPGVHLYFRPSKKNQMSAICAYESNLKFFLILPFPGEPEKSTKHEFEQANISLAKRVLY